MRQFMGEDFLLTTETAQKIFDKGAKNTPIFDWHCHLSPKEIYENKKPRDIAELWLGGDHYKWRGMRGYGIDEKYITGDSTPKEKFLKYAEALPYCIGNPLYHWTHLELQRYFGITKPLSSATAEEIWEECNRQINAGGFTPRELIEKSNVYCGCTTDDAADSLEYHKLLAEDKSFKCKVLPAFRPDKALGIELPGYNEWVVALENVISRKVTSFTELKKALLERIEFFAEMGCRASDHAFTYVPYNRADEDELNDIFARQLKGEALCKEEIDKYKTELMLFLAGEYNRLGWGMEIHIGAMRNNNGIMFKKLGPDTGYDSVADYEIAVNLSRLLDAMLCGAGGAPRAAIALGQKDKEGAEQIMGNCFSLLLGFAVILTAVFYFSAPTLLSWFGGSENTLPHAIEYAQIYILGSI